METLEQAPWVPYLVIDEKTHERKIKDNAPEEIKNKYYEYKNNFECDKASNSPIAK